MTDSVCEICAKRDECPIGHSGFSIRRCGNAILLPEEQEEQKRKGARAVEQK